MLEFTSTEFSQAADPTFSTMAAVVEGRQDSISSLTMTHRLLTQPVDYSGPAAGSRFSAARNTRALADWSSPTSMKEAGKAESAQQLALPPHLRLHPDRARTFCLPDGWTSEAQLDEDLSRLHTATARPDRGKASNQWSLAVPRSSTTVEPTKTNRTKRSNQRRTKTSKPVQVITRFGDSQLPPPPAPQLTGSDKDIIDGQHRQNKDLFVEKPRAGRAVISTVESREAFREVPESYFTMTPNRTGGVAVRQVSAGARLALVGRNGFPATAPPAAADAEPELAGRLVRPNLCWTAELADPSATVLTGAQPSSKEAAAAAAQAADLEAQRRSRQIVEFDHAGEGALPSAREAAILSRLRARSSVQQKQQQQQQQQQQPLRRELTASDYASLVPIAESLDSLRRSNTQPEWDAVQEPSKSRTAKAVTSSKPTEIRRGSRPRRAAPPLLARPEPAAATFSPRRDQEADASLVVSTLTAPTVREEASQSASAAAAGVRRVTTGRALSSSSSTNRRQIVGGGEGYLSIVSSVNPGRLWSTGGVVLPAQQAPLPPTQPRPPPPPVSSAPLPSTPREEAAPPPELSAASTVSLTSTKNSDCFKETAVVKIPRAD